MIEIGLKGSLRRSGRVQPTSKTYGGTMPKKLPARPNLEHLRTQAKGLLARLREGDRSAAKAFTQYLPEAAGLSPKQIFEREFRLADAQAVIARRSGFSAWPGLTHHVDSLRRMEGTWAFRFLEIDGRPMPHAVITTSLLLIDGDRFRMESPEANYEGVFTIDVEAEPPEIDIDFIEGPEAGNRCEGIYRLDGDQLTFCLGLVGSARPQGFATSQGSGHALEVLVRADSARPAGVDGGTPLVAERKRMQQAVPTTFDTPMTPTLEKLQGEWIPLELTNSGTPLQASFLPFGSRAQSGGETKVIFGGQTMVHAKIRFDESATPIKVDYLNLAGNGSGSLSLGLFRWNGDEAVFCMAAPGTPRPPDFSCDTGSGRTLSRWKRKI
jgi:uncharacterized protein (TIGR03067 family)